MSSMKCRRSTALPFFHPPFTSPLQFVYRGSKLRGVVERIFFFFFFFFFFFLIFFLSYCLLYWFLAGRHLSFSASGSVWMAWRPHFSVVGGLAIQLWSPD